MLNALFILEILTFFPDFLVMKKKGLIRKLKVLKFMTSQRRQQIIAINILPTISRSNGNQAIIKRGPKEYFSLKIVQKIR